MLPVKVHWDTIIIGGGQAGLATGYFLKKKRSDFIILDKSKKVGDSWRERWDSLSLFTPSRFDNLPGMKLLPEYGIFPGKNQIAEYLEKYSAKFELPVYNGLSVTSLSSQKDHFEIVTTTGLLTSKNVIVATGTNPFPRIPHFADQLSSSIFQIHSSAYKNADMLPEGDVLVVGGGTSGVEIAVETASKRNTHLSGNPTFHIPDPVFRYASGLYWWLISSVLTINTPMGRKAKKGVLKGGAPLIRISADDLKKAGVSLLPKVVGVKNQLILFEDGTARNFNCIIWATGYKPDFSWISPDITDETGWPINNRGISHVKGLNFIGLPFQYSLTSGLIGGVGRDAEYITRHL